MLRFGTIFAMGPNTRSVADVFELTASADRHAFDEKSRKGAHGSLLGSLSECHDRARPLNGIKYWHAGQLLHLVSFD